MNVCNGKCNNSFSSNEIHNSFPILSIPITAILNEKFNNPMNIVFNEYFSTSKRLCDDIRCKGGIINYNVTTYFNNFLFPEILIFLIDTLDFKTLKKNYIKIKSLFNQLLIVDEIQYDLIGYYLMPFQNHFIVLFKN